MILLNDVIQATQPCRIFGCLSTSQCTQSRLNTRSHVNCVSFFNSFSSSPFSI